jgi:hypothetical protein
VRRIGILPFGLRCACEPHTDCWRGHTLGTEAGPISLMPEIPSPRS